MSEYLLDDHRILDIRDDAHRPAAGRTDLDVDPENPLEALRPGHRGTAFGRCQPCAVLNVSHLRWDQVDLDRAMAWIHPDQSKSRKAIAVPLNEDALTVLRRRGNKHPEYVFTYQGAPVSRTTTKAWHKALKRAGIANFRWHNLRHTWASWHVQNGTSLQELRSWEVGRLLRWCCVMHTWPANIFAAQLDASRAEIWHSQKRKTAYA